MKKIGILLRPDMSLKGNKIMLANKEISDIIIKLNCLPIGIFPPYIDDFYNKKIFNTKIINAEELKQYQKTLDLCDGLILQGGNDFYHYDIEAIKYFYELNKPVLGICLGMQSMAYFLGGREEKIGNAFHNSQEPYVHDVILDERSILFDIFQEKIIRVNSRHNYHMTGVDNNYVTGISEDNVIEVIEDKSKKFFLGVEWHPESMIEYDEKMYEIFRMFVHNL